MNRMMSGWLTSGRRTKRSIASASKNMTPMVMASARKAGTPCAYKPTNVSAENTTMMPCAKLNTPEALKISTKPSAISA